MHRYILYHLKYFFFNIHSQRIFNLVTLINTLKMNTWYVFTAMWRMQIKKEDHSHHYSYLKIIILHYTLKTRLKRIIHYKYENVWLVWSHWNRTDSCSYSILFHIMQNSILIGVKMLLGNHKQPTVRSYLHDVSKLNRSPYNQLSFTLKSSVCNKVWRVEFSAFFKCIGIHCAINDKVNVVASANKSLHCPFLLLF